MLKSNWLTTEIKHSAHAQKNRVRPEFAGSENEIDANAIDNFRSLTRKIASDIEN